MSVDRYRQPGRLAATILEDSVKFAEALLKNFFLFSNQQDTQQRYGQRRITPGRFTGAALAAARR
jgi:hypothetical protein